MKNAWVDEIRAQRRRDQVHAPEEAGATVGERLRRGPRHARSRCRRASRACLRSGAWRSRWCLVEGLSYKEAAETLGVPIGTLTSRLAREPRATQATSRR